MVDGPHMEERDPDVGAMILKILLGIILLPIIIWKPSILTIFVYGNKDNKVPTRYLRVNDVLSGQERLVQMKGEPERGMLSQGDIAAFWGRWEGGTLKMERGYNHRLSTDVHLKR